MYKVDEEDKEDEEEIIVGAAAMKVNWREGGGGYRTNADGSQVGAPDVNSLQDRPSCPARRD